MKKKQYYLNLILLNFISDSTLTKAMKDVKHIECEGEEKNANDVILSILKAFKMNRAYIPYDELTLKNAISLLLIDHYSPISILNFLNDRVVSPLDRDIKDSSTLVRAATGDYKGKIKYLDNCIQDRKEKLTLLESNYGIHAVQYDKIPSQPHPEYDKTASIVIKLDELQTDIKELEERKKFLKEKEDIRKEWLLNLDQEKKEIIYSAGREKEKIEILKDFKEKMS